MLPEIDSLNLSKSKLKSSSENSFISVAPKFWKIKSPYFECDLTFLTFGSSSLLLNTYKINDLNVQEQDELQMKPKDRANRSRKPPETYNPGDYDTKKQNEIINLVSTKSDIQCLSVDDEPQSYHEALNSTNKDK
jgi:hypothetical protein